MMASPGFWGLGGSDKVEAVPVLLKAAFFRCVGIRPEPSFVFERAVPLLGGLLSGDRGAYRYLPASASYLPPAKELAAMLRAAGFEELRKRNHLGGALQAIQCRGEVARLQDAPCGE